MVQRETTGVRKNIGSSRKGKAVGDETDGQEDGRGRSEQPDT